MWRFHMILSRRRLLTGSAAVFAAAPLLARAAEAPSPATGAAAAFVAAVDGDVAARERWIDTWMSPAGVKRPPREEPLKVSDGLQRVSGGLDLVSVAPGERGPVVAARARRSGAERAFDLRMDR